MNDNYNDRIINDALRMSGYYPLRPMQLWMIDSQFYKLHSTMLNQSILWKLSPEIDLNRLAQAINEILETYDVFRCRLVFHPRTDDICQRFDGEIIPAKIEKLSDEEFEERKKNLMIPYELHNKPLYRINLLETPSAKYIYLDMYHSIMDGTAIILLFMREMNLRYSGKKIKRDPASYADYILEDMKVSTEEFEAGAKHWLDTLDKIDEKNPFDGADLFDETINEENFDWKKGYLAQPIKNVTRDFFVTTKSQEHIFFFAAALLTLAKVSGKKSSIMDYLHIGRYNSFELRLMGAMIEQFPVYCEFEDGMTAEDLTKTIEEKLKISMTYRKSLGVAYNSEKDICPTFVFQKKIHETMNNMTVGGYRAEKIELPENEYSVTENTLDVEVNQSADGTYWVEYTYGTMLYSDDAIKNIAATFDEIVLKLQDKNVLIADILK